MLSNVCNWLVPVQIMFTEQSPDGLSLYLFLAKLWWHLHQSHIFSKLHIDELNIISDQLIRSHLHSSIISFISPRIYVNVVGQESHIWIKCSNVNKPIFKELKSKSKVYPSSTASSLNIRWDRGQMPVY